MGLKRQIKSRVLTTFLTLAGLGLASSASAQNAGIPGWEYNPGPDPKTAEGKKLIDIYAEQPEYMLMSNELIGEQKFRYIYGLMMTRTYFNRNGVKILFIGQDATHIAEAAKQPGTSGFGARVQSFGNFFGVDQSIATTNAFLSTIKGQYGGAMHPFVEYDAKGQPRILTTKVVDNRLWLLANGKDSAIRQQREAFWEWMIKNNPDSLGMMATMGGAAADAFAEFLIARGANVETKLDANRLKNIRVPETDLKFSGGNGEFPVPVTKEGKDIYEILLGRRPDYSKEADQKAAIKALKDAGQKAIDMMVFVEGGVSGSGLVSAAQLGGYDLEKVSINGQITNSLKGLKLSDGTVITRDIAFTMSAHPTALSRLSAEEASKKVREAFARLTNLKEKGWKIEPDLDENGKSRRNLWHEGKDYEYGRADIRPGYFEFGAPDDRRVSRADASRLDPQTIVAGSRDRVKFDKALIESAKERLPSETLNPKDMWSVRPRDGQSRYVFDRGPGKEIAKALVESIDRELLFKPKEGMESRDTRGNDDTFEKHGIDAYNTKTHPGTGLFGFHRGNFEGSRVLILADPQGIDDWITARAMTGARGQYLNGLMSDLGFGEKYLVIKTVPVGMDGASAEEWEVVREKTEKYRETTLKIALSKSQFEIIFADGDIAQKEIQRILKKMKVSDIPVINIRRGENNSDGIQEAGREAQKALGLRGEISGNMKDIPRSHLTWWSRVWEGTSGDRVIDATGKHRGGVRALVAPTWVVKQRVQLSPAVEKSIRAIEETLENLGLRTGKERLSDFLSRKGHDGKIPAAEKSDGKMRSLKQTVPVAPAKGGALMCGRIYQAG